jgi:hypothetical protein
MRDVAIAFRNRSASWIWGFAALWLTLLGAMTYVVARDGAPTGYSWPIVIGIMAFFWAGGIGLVAFVLRKPCIRVTVERDSRVSATWRYPHKVVRKRFDAEQVRPAEVVDARDDEDNPYFYARVRTAGSDFFDLAEGHTRALCESACDQFNRALQGQGKR